MNFRFTAFLFVGVVALVVALLIVNLTDPPPRAGAGLLEPLALAGVKPADVDTVEITRTEPVAETLVFAKVGEGRWELREPHRAKAEGAALDGLVRGLFQAKPTLYDGLTENLISHGLDKPVKVTLKAGGNAATVAVGKTTQSGVNAKVTFVLAAGRPTVPVAVPSQDLRPLFREATADTVGSAADLTKRANDFRQLRLLSLNAASQGADVATLKLSRGEKTLELARQADGEWTFTTPAGYGLADNLGDTKANAELLTGVQPLLTALDAFRPAAREDYIEPASATAPPDFAKYGLAADDPTVLRIEVTPKGGPPEVLFVGKAVETNGVPAVPAKVYCRLDGDPAVVPVQTDRARILANTVANSTLMRNRDLIPDARKPRIDALDVTVGATAFKLRKVGVAPDQKWAVYGGPSDPSEGAILAVDDLIRAACAPRAATDVLLVPSPTAFVLAEVKGTVKVYFDGIAAPTALVGGKLPPTTEVVEKASAPPVTLTFGQVTPTAIHVRRVIGTGPPTDFLLPLTPKEGEKTTLAALAARPRLEYLKPDVGSFSPAAVARVTATRGAEPVYDLTFTEFDNLSVIEKGWFPKLTFPLGKCLNAGKPASHAAADQLLNFLGGLDRSQPVAEAPPDPELTAWGLKPARLTVTVVLKSDPTKPRVYEFGNEILPAAGKYYFRVAGKLMVLAADKFAVDSVEKADLRDPVIHRVDRAALGRVDLSWRADTGQVDTLFVVPDPKAKWAATEPAGFNLNADKADELVRLLELPTGGAFVPGPEKPEYRLNGDVLRAVLHRHPLAAVEFIFGAEDETKAFVYAKSNETPGVVKLPAAPFRPFLAGRKALGK